MRLEIKEHVFYKSPHHSADRDMKNVAQDVKLLENLGLVSTRKEKAGRKGVSPSVDYDAIELMIAV